MVKIKDIQEVKKEGYIIIKTADGKEIEVPQQIDSTIYGHLNRPKRLETNYSRKGFYVRWIKDQDIRDFQQYFNRGFRRVKGIDPRYGGRRGDGSVYYKYLVEMPLNWYIELYENPRLKRNFQETSAALKRQENVFGTIYKPREYTNKVEAGGVTLSEYNVDDYDSKFNSSLRIDDRRVGEYYDSEWD